MQKFLIKFLIFIFPLILLFGWWEHRLARIPNTYSTKAGLIEKALPDCEILVLGSSHAFRGINPSLLTLPGFNMADNSQTLYYDFEIAARYVPQMPQLKYVFFTVSYSSLENLPLSKGPESFRVPFYHRYYKLPVEHWFDHFDIRNYSLIALYGMTKSVEYLKQGFKVDLADGVTSNGWMDVAPEPDQTHKYISDELGKVRVDLLHQLIMKPEYIEYNRSPLLSAIRLCQSRNVLPVLITTPVYHTYRDHMNAEFYGRMQGVVKELCKETGVLYYNHLDDQRFDIEDFDDNDHLNSKGAEKFTKILDAEILHPAKAGPSSSTESKSISPL